jgi:hypothetical protein
MTPERYTMEREQETERQKPRPNRVRLRTCAFPFLARNGNPGRTNTMLFIHEELADLFAGSSDTRRD